MHVPLISDRSLSRLIAYPRAIVRHEETGNIVSIRKCVAQIGLALLARLNHDSPEE